MPGILLAIGYTALLLYAMRRMPFFARVPGLPLRWVAGFFLLKIAAGTALWVVYTRIYPERVHADIFKFFDDSAVMFSALPERPGDYLRMLFAVGNDTPWFDERYYMVMNNWYRQFESNLYNDAHTMIRFNAALRLLSFGEYHVHTVFAAFCALAGMVGIHRAFVKELPGRERALAWVVFAVPSVLFWASGVLKESLLFLGLGLLVWLVRRFLRGRFRWSDGPVLVACLLLLFTLKLYVLLSLVPALAAFALARWSGRTLPSFAGVYALMVALVVLSAQVPGWNVLDILAWKQWDFIGLARATEAGSFVAPEPLEPTLWSFVRHAPGALWSATMGPLLHHAGGALGLATVAEGIALLALLAFCLWMRRPWHTLDGPLLLALLAFCCTLLLVIGYTTPVMGAVVRYRTPMLPFLLIAALLVLDHHTVLQRWPRLKPLFHA
jgi:hypothetical protein